MHGSILRPHRIGACSRRVSSVKRVEGLSEVTGKCRSQVAGSSIASLRISRSIAVDIRIINDVRIAYEASKRRRREGRTILTSNNPLNSVFCRHLYTLDVRT